MDEARPAFTVEEFEYVEAGSGLALLRLAGQWRDDDTPPGISLVATSGDKRLTLSALPAPPAGNGTWRAAYSASPALLRDAESAFELVTRDGDAIPLPRPLPHGTERPPVEVRAQPAEPEPEPKHTPPRRTPEPDAPKRPTSRIFGRRRQPQTADSGAAAVLSDALADERSARQAAERDAAEERARAQRAEAVLAEELRSTVGKTEELIERIDGYEHNRVSFEEELDAVRRTHADLLAETEDEHRKETRELRTQLQDAQRELSAAHDELDAANHHIDTLNEAHSLELGAARSQRDTAEEHKSTLEGQVSDLRADVENLRTRLDDREGLIERARAEAAAAGHDTAELHEAMARLRDAIHARARDAASGTRRFTRDDAELDRSREELRRDAERIAALERQAEALRDAIHSQLPYSLHASPLQEALPVTEPEETPTQVDA